MKPIDCKSLIEKYNGKENNKHILNDVLRGLFLQALDEVKWRKGLNGLASMASVQAAELNLHEVWTAVEEGSKTMADFKITLKEWKHVVERSKLYICGKKIIHQRRLTDEIYTSSLQGIRQSSKGSF